MIDTPIVIYTDGSCNPRLGIGGWAATVQISDNKVVLSGFAKQTTHQRMELLAVVKSIEFLVEKNLSIEPIIVYTDSQYVVGLPPRRAKLTGYRFMTRGNLPVANKDLVIVLTRYLEEMNITLVKLKAHQPSELGNQEVDKLSRKIVREMVINEK